MTDVWIMCPGVGHIGRGYESFSKELFDELKQEPEIKASLLKGAGPSGPNEHAMACLRRTGSVAQFLGKVAGQSSYHIEQITFFISSLPRLLLQKPHVIVYSDFYLGVLLWYLRKYLHLNYKLLFSNGAPNGPPFTRCDYVQQLLPFYKEQALQAGESPSRHIVLPYAIEIASDARVLTVQEKKEFKRRLNIEQKTMILCVAAINDSHKRISYLLEEVHALADSDICLVVLGQQNEESPLIIQKGKELLKEHFVAHTVEKKELDIYYKAADLFVLPSLSEGLPRVMLEALSYGLPVLSHDYEVSRNVLGKYGYYADFKAKGQLCKLIEEVKMEADKQDLVQAEQRISYVKQHYSWTSLRPLYKEMILKISSGL